MYVDGFVLPVARQNKEKYIRDAHYAAQVLMDHGATRVVECWGDEVPEGKLTSIPLAVKLQEGEVACFSWIEYPDKKTRDRCHKLSEADPRFERREGEVPAFDGTRLIWGGFAAIVDE